MGRVFIALGMYTELCLHSSVYIPAHCLCTRMTEVLRMYRSDVIPCRSIKMDKKAGEKILARDFMGVRPLELR